MNVQIKKPLGKDKNFWQAAIMSGRPGREKPIRSAFSVLCEENKGLAPSSRRGQQSGS